VQIVIREACINKTKNLSHVYQNERESGGKRIAFDKYDVGKVNVETTIVLSQQDKGRSFSDRSGI
jgi:hypothetical protein